MGVYCAHGKSTELTARQFGFINIFTSEGTVDSLTELIVRTLDIKFGKLLSLCNDQISKRNNFCNCRTSEGK